MSDGDRENRTRVEVCPVDQLPPGARTIVDVDGREVGVFNVDGEFHAIRNACPHQLAPLAEGQLTGEMTAPAVGEYELTRQGEIIRCPWHGWQFDLKTGASVFNPRVRTSTYEVAVEKRPPCGTCGEGDESDGDAGTEEYGTRLAGDEPPVDTYDVEIEAEAGREVVVLYV
jgi:nitrite reductase/ring-hydroxylating ferredoxin subunit